MFASSFSVCLFELSLSDSSVEGDCTRDGLMF